MDIICYSYEPQQQIIYNRKAFLPTGVRSMLLFYVPCSFLFLALFLALSQLNSRLLSTSANSSFRVFLGFLIFLLICILAFHIYSYIIWSTRLDVRTNIGIDSLIFVLWAFSLFPSLRFHSKFCLIVLFIWLFANISPYIILLSFLVSIQLSLPNIIIDLIIVL